MAPLKSTSRRTTVDCLVPSGPLAIYRIPLQRELVRSTSKEARAWLVCPDDAFRVLDQLDLAPSDKELVGEVALYAARSGVARRLRVEISGPGADAWRVGPAELVEEAVGELVGHEDWYASRDEFYGRSYFERTDGGSGYAAGSLDDSRAAQETFVEELLRHVPFGSSLEFGCAAGGMVAALRSRGVEARGVDLSAFAIRQAPRPVRAYLEVGDFSALSSIQSPIEAVIGQEVFEHVPPQDLAGIFRAAHSASCRWLIFTVPATPQPGLHCVKDFADLPRDAEGNPVEGHLIQASWWWWASQAVRAGFDVDESLGRRVRRGWGETSRWWDLFVCRRCADTSASEIRRRLDRLLVSAWTPLRQDLRRQLIGTGSLSVQDGSPLIQCSPDDRPGWLYYGPYLDAEEGTLTFSARVRLSDRGQVLAGDGTVLLIEISSARRVLHRERVSGGDLCRRRGEWIPIRRELAVSEDKGIQAKIYFTGLAHVDVAWPIECGVG